MANQVGTEYSALHLCANAPWQHATFWYSRVPLQNNHVSFLLVNTRGWCNRALPIPSPTPCILPSTAANKLTSVLRSCTAKWGCPVVAEAICAPAGGSLLPVLAVPSVAILSNHVLTWATTCVHTILFVVKDIESSYVRGVAAVLQQGLWEEVQGGEQPWL